MYVWIQHHVLHVKSRIILYQLIHNTLSMYILLFRSMTARNSKSTPRECFISRSLLSALHRCVEMEPLNRMSISDPELGVRLLLSRFVNLGERELHRPLILWYVPVICA